MSRFIPVDRQTDYLLPPSVDEWLPDGHLARFVVAVVEPLDLSALTWRYAGRGHNAHHPAVLLSLLVYGYASGVYTSRKIEARAEERDATEQAAYQEKVARREAQRKAGKKPRGRDPEPPTGGPHDKDQVSLTDPQSRIMPVTGKGFDQCYNAQAAVDTDTLLVTHVHVTQAPNDKQQVAPLIGPLYKGSGS
jgi:hypothetical protein